MVLEEEEEEVKKKWVFIWKGKKQREKLMLDSAKGETELSEEYIYSRM